MAILSSSCLRTERTRTGIGIARAIAELREVQTGDEALAAMLTELAKDTGTIPPIFEPVGIEEQGRLDEKAKAKCPECGHEFTP